jgi:hypothetical protein
MAISSWDSIGATQKRKSDALTLRYYVLWDKEAS